MSPEKMAQAVADVAKFGQGSDVALLALAEGIERTVSTLHTKDDVAATGTRAPGDADGARVPPVTRIGAGPRLASWSQHSVPRRPPAARRADPAEKHDGQRQRHGPRGLRRRRPAAAGGTVQGRYDETDGSSIVNARVSTGQPPPMRSSAATGRRVAYAAGSPLNSNPCRGLGLRTVVQAVVQTRSTVFGRLYRTIPKGTVRSHRAGPAPALIPATRSRGPAAASIARTIPAYPDYTTIPAVATEVLWLASQVRSKEPAMAWEGWRSAPGCLRISAAD